ncbi:T9SS type A sorting domain-containing protein [Meridianimaribacter flavus]|uniref:Secreted protein (Por secretion system target) n=1 Tax=Meridianimaribacter flavus TaxID=571115 RepID=A0ABY2G533_9FLAO|nr:T9SS type A sorting domain-containing protein [Meridianimaribacter flavus]TDY11926.1 putative secreted protein (Por secretion system target) [Meridianimaribacter flavus]
MKLKLFFTLLFLSIYSNAQEQIFNIPETWDIDIWNGGSWLHFSNIEYTFNENCMPILVESQVLDFGSGVFVDSSRLTITYNGNNEPLENINELWNVESNSWENELRTTYIYNSENLTTTQNYEWQNEAWVLVEVIIEEYDTQAMAYEVIYQDYVSATDTYVNTGRNVIQYNNFERIDNILYYDWDIVEDDWVHRSRQTYVYDTNQLATQSILEDWEGEQWVNDVLEVFTYDVNHFLIETLKSDWNTASSSYETNSRELITNDAEGNPIEMITQSYLFGSWVNSTRDRRTYPDCLTLSDEEVAFEEINIYPIPATDELTIENTTQQDFALQLFDINGKLIKVEQLLNYRNNLDVSSFNSGVYILKLSNQSGVYTKRIIKQ